LSILDIKAPTFAQKLDVQYQRIFDIQRGKTKKISGDLATTINAVYSRFPIDWLLSEKAGKEDLPEMYIKNWFRLVDMDELYKQKKEHGYLLGPAMRRIKKNEEIKIIVENAIELAVNEANEKILSLEKQLLDEKKNNAILKAEIEILKSGTKKSQAPTTPQKTEKKPKNSKKK
jgi:hypothetical protein